LIRSIRTFQCRLHPPQPVRLQYYRTLNLTCHSRHSPYATTTTTILIEGGTRDAYTYTVKGEVAGTSGSQTYKVDYSYDPQGRMRTMTTYQSETDTQVTEWIYDAQRGWLVEKVYDSNGQGQSQATPANHTVYTYTDAGRLETRVWARGITTSYGYNAAGDLASVDYSDATPDVTTTYTRWGAVDTVTYGAGSRTMSYGSNLQPLTEAYSGNIDRILTRAYDSLGRDSGFELGTSGDPDADHKVAYNYDNAGRLNAVTGHGTYASPQAP
jgi:YD repeat-containing protein